MTYAQKASDIPKGEHWAIIRSSSVYIPGDERSRTNPGHGYPAETENFISYEVFTTEDAFNKAMAAAAAGDHTRHRDVIGIHVTTAFVFEPKVQVVKSS